jgi:hypothetical protein
MPRIKLKNDDLEEHLKEQIELLDISCNSYDSGQYIEAKRIAVIIRILFHDTGHSKSLLGQLGRKSDSFFSSNLPIVEESLFTHSGLTMIGMKGKDTLYFPKLDEMAFKTEWLPFSEWWDEKIIKDNKGNTITRGQLIKFSTNQDGGAHVDQALDEIYYNLKKTNSLQTTIFDGKQQLAIPNAEKAAIRQIGHEVLKTLIVDYQREQNAKVDLWVSGSTLIKGSKVPPIPKSKKIGRNEKCPCGSNIKYKFCHGK